MEEEKVEYPSYSVLMSVYAKENPEYLRLAVDSMLQQTVAPSCIVMVEDGPLTQELYAVLDEYTESKADIFVRVVNETNLGLGRALQRGLEFCRTEWIARMDTDDISKADRCEKQLKFLTENPDVDIVGTYIEEFCEPSQILSVREVPCVHSDICNFMKKRNPLNHVSVMFKKTAVEKAGGYCDMLYYEDYYLWVRMYLAGCRFANIPENLVEVRVGKEMYARRGGKLYYKSGKRLFKFMYDNKMISWAAYQKAKAVRYIAQVLMPNKMRQWAYKKFVRK